MSKSVSQFRLVLIGKEEIFVTAEEADKVKQVIETQTSVEIREYWIRTSAIMAILPAEKTSDNPTFRSYLNEVNRFGYTGSFESFRDQSGRSTSEARKELPPVNQQGLDAIAAMKRSSNL